ncbi:MAG: hypothetical protein AB7G13_28715 [Lautropia sp.]
MSAMEIIVWLLVERLQDQIVVALIAPALFGAVGAWRAFDRAWPR